LPEEGNADYLTRCLNQAIERKAVLFHKKGDPRHCLGLPATAAEAAEQKSKQYTARGAPHEWYQEELEDFLEKQGWKNAKAIHKQRFRREWRFVAVAPISDKQYNYQIDDGPTITLVLAPAKPKSAS